MIKVIFLCFVIILVSKSESAYVKRDVESSTQNILQSFQKNMDAFRKCVDEGLARSVNDVNVNQLQPVFSVIGDQVNRFSKAFEDLTAKSTTTPASIWS